MINISTAERTSIDIFRAIMDHGPLSLYSATSKTKISIGTVHRHFKQLQKTGMIRIYSLQKGGRKKIEYGPTIHGMVSVYRKDADFAEKIENYFLIWIERKEFQEDLAGEGFDTSIENLKRSKHVFRKYMDYFSAVVRLIDRTKRGDEDNDDGSSSSSSSSDTSMSAHEMQVFFSSMTLSSDSHYRKLWIDLYNELPGMQKSLDEQMENLIASYREFKKSFKK